MAAGHGGARSGAGRKPRPAEKLKRDLTERLDDARFAFDLFVRTMRDAKQPLSLRLECSSEVMNRVLGKPKQAVHQVNSGEMVIRVEYDDCTPNPDAPPPEATPGPA